MQLRVDTRRVKRNKRASGSEEREKLRGDDRDRSIIRVGSVGVVQVRNQLVHDVVTSRGTDTWDVVAVNDASITKREIKMTKNAACKLYIYTRVFLPLWNDGAVNVFYF